MLPFRVTNQFLECVSVPVLQKVAGLLPAKDVVGWHAPGGAAIFAPAHQELEKQRTHIELPLLIAITENLTEQATCFLSTEEMFLVGGFVVRIAGREHESFDAQVHHLVKEFTHALRVCACEQGGVGGYAEPTFQRFAHGFNRLVVGAFPTDGEIVVLTLPVHVDYKREILAGLELVEFLVEQESVGTEINVLLARQDAFNDLCNAGMHERLASGDAHHGCATLVHRLEAFFRAEVFLQNMGRVLDLSAAGASQVAPHQRFQH